MNLSHDTPRMSAEGAARLKSALEVDCSCGGDVGTLRRRLIRAAVTVHLQCDNCGSSRAALKREDHYYWQNYPEWDATLPERYDYGRNEITRTMVAKRNAERADAWSLKRQEYAQFCRDNPEWHALRNAVIDRAQGQCEACLSACAVTAHHLSYDYGPLPPAWLLRAVCATCHRRLHASKHGTSDEWEPYVYAAMLTTGS